MSEAVACYAPFQKSRIDIGKRMVWGIAQVEDVEPDTQGDIVDYNATLKAFSAWPGNVREMHQPVAVGKRVSAVPLPGQRAILVGVHVSKGAEDTWQKVLDGTLTGFSIGGYATKKRKVYDAKLGKYVNRIEEYVLTELSLVDSPANPRCKITGITKRNGAIVASDVLGDIQAEVRNMAQGKAAAQSITKFASSATDNEEFIMVKRSDLEASDGKLVVKKSAEVLKLQKGDFDGDGFSDDAGVQPDAGDGVADMNLDGHAKNAYDLHDVLHKMAGSTCNCAGGGAGAGDAGNGGDLGMGKAAGATGADLDARIAKAVGSALDGITKKLDSLTNTGEVAARRTAPATAGSVVQKDAAHEAGTTTVDALTGANDEPAALITKFQTQVNDLTAEAQTLISKRNAGMTLTDAERLRIDSLQDELAKAKTRLHEAQRGNFEKVR